MPKFSTDTRVDTVIVGGQIVGSSQVYDSSIAIKGEKIVAIGPEQLLPEADRYIEAHGKFVRSIHPLHHHCLKPF